MALEALTAEQDRSVSANLLHTNHLLPHLGRETASGALYSGAAQGVRFVTNIGATVVLARLLTPQDFGLVAMVVAVTGFFEMFKDAGLSTATIQRAEISHAQVSNLFWANIGIGLLLTALIAALAPALGAFYHDSRLAPVALALSATFLLTAAGVQHQAVLRRQMRFGALAAIQTVGAILSAVAAIGFAVAGAKYWALVIAAVVLAGTTCVLSWAICAWRPSWPVRRVATRSLFTFGAHITGASLVQTVVGTADNLLLGRQYGAASVGIYSRGTALTISPLQQLLSPFHSVLVPALSRIQSDPHRYRAAFLKILDVLGVLALPLAGFLAGASTPLVLVLLGEQWREVVPVFAAFAIIAVYAPLASAATWLFTSQGRGRELLTSSVVVSIITLLAIVAGLPFGPVGVAVSIAGSGVLVRLPLLFFFAGRNGPVSRADLWRALAVNLPVGISTLLVAVVACRAVGPTHSALQLTAAAAACTAVFIAWVSLSPHHRRVVRDVISRVHELTTDRLGRAPRTGARTELGSV